jgi:hypothetical protein
MALLVGLGAFGTYEYLENHRRHGYRREYEYGLGDKTPEYSVIDTDRIFHGLTKTLGVIAVSSTLDDDEIYKEKLEHYKSALKLLTKATGDLVKYYPEDFEVKKLSEKVEALNAFVAKTF